METLITPGSPSDTPTKASPSWVLLEPYVNNKVDNSDSSSVADAKTTAASCTSTGQSFSISFAVAPPPATSSYYCNWIGGPPGNRRRQIYPGGQDTSKNLNIIAAHDDFALIQMVPPNPESPSYSGHTNTCDYFLYEAGAGRTPLLALLPGCYFSSQSDRDVNDRHVPSRIDTPRTLDARDTALLRLVNGEHLVGQLEVIYQGDRPSDTAELCVLRPAGPEWELKTLAMVHHGGGKLPEWLATDAAFAVGDRFMCWVDYSCGFLFHDMADETFFSEVVVYIPLPIPLPEEHRHRNSDRPYLPHCRNLGAAGLNAVRFVSVASRCCCGGHGKTSCERSRFAFNVTTWTLTLKEGPMAWVKDGVLDCDELWQLPNYGCLPRVPPKYPIVSSDNHDVVCFLLCEDHYFIDNADETVWLLEIDTRSKALLSVTRRDTTGSFSNLPLPAKLSW